MQSVSSRIWTRVAVSISYDDNDYTTGTSYKSRYAIKLKQPTNNHNPDNTFIMGISLQEIQSAYSKTR